jgi:hypothetical protein
MAVRSALSAGPPFTHRKIPGTHLSEAQSTPWLEELSQLKIQWTRDLPACSVVPKLVQTTLPRAPIESGSNSWKCMTWFTNWNIFDNRLRNIFRLDVQICVDDTHHMNGMNVNLQGANETRRKITAFEKKPRMGNCNCDQAMTHFPTLRTQGPICA